MKIPFDEATLRKHELDDFLDVGPGEKNESLFLTIVGFLFMVVSAALFALIIYVV